MRLQRHDRLPGCPAGLYAGLVAAFFRAMVCTSSAAPPHDQCADAVDLALNIPYAGSNAGAGGQITSTCGFDDWADVWHRFVAPAQAEYLFSTCGSDLDTTLALYDTCGGAELACNDDACGWQSEVSIPLAAGQVVFVRVAGYNGEQDSYMLTATTRSCQLPNEPETPSPEDRALNVPRRAVLAWNDGAQMTHGPEPTLREIQTLVYGQDDRLDEYQVADERWRQVGDATAVVVSIWDLIDHGDGTLSLPGGSYAAQHLAIYGRPLCAAEPYRDQPAPGSCSAFLVAPDLVATAGHCVESDYDCEQTAFVFGFVMQDASSAILTFDPSQVYYCAGLVDRRETSDSDWALVRLDRPVLDHIPLDIRRSGRVADNESLFVVGHPLGLPRKYAGGATVRDNVPPSYFDANLDTYGGSSGSAVFNANSFQVEGVLYAGNEDFDTIGGCDVSNICPDGGCPGWEGVTRTTEFASKIEVYDVYLGTRPDAMTRVVTGTPKPWCRVTLGECGRTYYWQVVAQGECGRRPGPVWSFATIPAGDLNHDCTVDLEDLRLWAGAWLDECAPANDGCHGADIDRGGRVTLDDLAELAARWGASVED